MEKCLVAWNYICHDRTQSTDLDSIVLTKRPLLFCVKDKNLRNVGKYIN